MSIKKRLLEVSDENYKKFSSALIPNIDNVLGVRIPILRKIAKDIYKNGDWHSFLDIECEYMEESMLQGILTGLSCDINLVEKFVPKIDNWAVCDTFCTTLKFVRANKSMAWSFLQKYTRSKKEYDIRFALVMMLNYFIEEEYLHKIFSILDEFSSDKYYAQMAAAWLVSMCYVKYPIETETYLNQSKLDDWTFNKSIQKIIESLKVDKETKQKLKLLKR